MSKRMIILVCTGNVCRSPMAEYLLRKELGPDTDWDVISAGTSAIDGIPASQASVEVMEELGIDLSAHRSRYLEDDLVRQAALIVVMAGPHRDQIERMHPEAKGKVYLLKSFDARATGRDVDDPIGSAATVYRDIRDEIAAAMPGLIEYLKTFPVPPDAR